MILSWGLLLAAQAWAQTKGAPIDGAPALELVPIESPIEAPAAAVDSPSAPLERLSAESPLPAVLAPPTAEQGARVARQAERREAVARELRDVSIDRAPAADAKGLGDRLQAILEGAPSKALTAASEGDSLPPPIPAGQVLLGRVAEPRLRTDLEQKIYQDPLTGLPKRSWLDDRLGELVRAKSVVMLVDLDHFKTQVNDAYGHGVGDIALKQLASILAAPSPGRVAVRWGGEEFVIVDRLGPAQAKAAAEKLRADVERLLGPAVERRAFSELGRELPVGRLTISIGVAPIVRTAGSAHADWIASLSEADRLLYEAKNAGRNRVAAADGAEWLLARVRSPFIDRVRSWLRRGLPRPKAKRESVLSGHIRWTGRKAPRTVAELLEQVSDPSLRSELERKIYTDPLTGAFNRAHLNDHIGGLLERSRSVIAFDVDFFKRVNDEHGHYKGDDVLAALAAAMKRSFGSVYRMGGEEFLALSEEDAETAARRADAFRRELERTLGPSVGLRKVTVSIGVSAIGDEGEDAARFSAAVEAADEALYDSKHRGRNRVTLARRSP